jgi:hypothetical protein
VIGQPRKPLQVIEEVDGGTAVGGLPSVLTLLVTAIHVARAADEEEPIMIGAEHARDRDWLVAAREPELIDRGAREAGSGVETDPV